MIRHRFLIGRAYGGAFTADAYELVAKRTPEIISHFVDMMAPIWETISEHLVGYQWEEHRSANNMWMCFALFDDEFSALACEMVFTQSMWSRPLIPFCRTINADGSLNVAEMIPDEIDQQNGEDDAAEDAYAPEDEVNLGNNF